MSNHSNAFGGLAEEGSYTIDNLFIPAHVNGNHWITLRVNFTDQCIVLFDSMGTINTTYNKHLEALRRNLYQELHKDIPEQNWPGYARWSQTWPTQNLSKQSPKQSNGYDCGVFTVLSTYLMARGVLLSRDTYDQMYMDTAKLCNNLALTVLVINELRIDGQSRLDFQAASTVTNPSRKRRRNRRCSTAGGKRIRTETGCSNDSDRVHLSPLSSIVSAMPNPCQNLISHKVHRGSCCWMAKNERNARRIRHRATPIDLWRLQYRCLQSG